MLSRGGGIIVNLYEHEIKLVLITLKQVEAMNAYESEDMYE